MITHNDNAEPKKPKRKKAKIPPSLLPHACVVLATDCASVSGWSIWAGGVYRGSGEFALMSKPELLDKVCVAAVDLGKKLGLPVVLVYEKPFAGTSQGSFSGNWKVAFVKAGGVKTRMTFAYPAEWRSAAAGVLPPGYANKPRKEVRPKEQEVAARLAGRACGPDESPAVCLGKFGCHADKVARKLPGYVEPALVVAVKRARKLKGVAA